MAEGDLTRGNCITKFSIASATIVRLLVEDLCLVGRSRYRFSTRPRSYPSLSAPIPAPVTQPLWNWYLLLSASVRHLSRSCWSPALCRPHLVLQPFVGASFRSKRRGGKGQAKEGPTFCFSTDVCRQCTAPGSLPPSYRRRYCPRGVLECFIYPDFFPLSLLSINVVILDDVLATLAAAPALIQPLPPPCS